MFLSGMGIGRLQRCLLALALSSLWASASADTSGACRTKVIRDYAGFIDGLAPLPSPPINERLPFAPERVFFGSSGGGALQTGVGYRYYRLSYSPWPGNPVPVSLDWTVTTTLTPIDEAGRNLGSPRSDEQHVEELWSAGDSDANVLRFGFDVSDQPAIYRLEVEIENGGGEQLAAFGEYFRVLEPDVDLRPSLNRRVFRPGQRLRATLSNYGVAWYGYGYPWGVEYRRPNGAWVPSPVDFTAGVFLMPLLSLPPGESTSCWSGDVPRDAPPGRYRFVTSVFGPWLSGLPSRHRRPIRVGFTVLPRKDFATSTAVGRRTTRRAS